jgi:hypothetical protein
LSLGCDCDNCLGEGGVGGIVGKGGGITRGDTGGDTLPTVPLPEALLAMGNCLPRMKDCVRLLLESNDPEDEDGLKGGEVGVTGEDELG